MSFSQGASTGTANERTTLKNIGDPQLINRSMIFGKRLLIIAVVNFCWSAYRIINYSFAIDDNPAEYETQKVHYLTCSIGLIFNTISIVVSSLLCYAAFYADALHRSGRLLLIPYIVWQPIAIGFEIGILAYIIAKNYQNIPDEIVIYSIAIILLTPLYFAVCLQLRYYKNVAKDNEKKMRNFAVSSQEFTHPCAANNSSYTSFRDVLPTY